jgi:hypothetical protein
MRFLSSIMSILFFLGACGTSGEKGTPDSLSQDRAAFDLLPDAPDGTPDQASTPDSLPADGTEVVETVEPGCPVDPLAGLSLAYEGAEADPTEYASDPLFLAIVDAAFAAAADSTPPLELTRETFPVYDFQPEDSPKGRLDWESRVRHDYFGLLGFLETFQDQLAERSEDVDGLLSFLSDKLDLYIEPGSTASLLEASATLGDAPGALACALPLFDAAPLAADALPADLQAPLARFLYALHFSRALQDEAFSAARDAIPFDEALHLRATNRTFGALADPDGLEAAGKLTDFRQLLRGAALLALALDRLAEETQGLDLAEKVRIETSIGAILLAGTGVDYHKGPEGPFLLILDLGGNDRYYGTLAASQPGVPVSLVLDLAGDDHYESTLADPAYGAGFLGYGLLWDRDGDDVYSAKFNSVAAACLGIGIIRDGGGDDLYDSIGDSQAAAALGAALLLDEGGDDHYYAFRASQAYGFYRGAALLLDVWGNDLFEAEDDVVLYPAAQNPDFNGNMGQGAGQGFRNDSVEFTDTYCGGIGTLADLEGDDVYTGAVFAQGVGYWFGAGFLIDAAGSDSYSGVWYNHGAAAHFAGGAHLDSGGDDQYFCLQDQCMGEGRDYSIGFMANRGGNDAYHAKGNRNIGAGDLFGTGILWDDAGSDTYQDDQGGAVGWAFSEAETQYAFTFGLFLDTGGTEDTYDLPADHPGNDLLWTQLGNANSGVQVSVQALGRDL